MGILKNEIMRTYNMRPSTAERCMEILEVIDSITKTKYERGFADGRKPTWIPCSERLPEKDVNVLTTWTYEHSEPEVTVAHLIDWHGLCWEEWAEAFTHELDEVIAWMSFPEPWRGEEHETD